MPTVWVAPQSGFAFRTAAAAFNPAPPPTTRSATGVEAEAQRSRELILEAQRSSQERLLEAQRSLLIRQLTRKIGSMPVDMIHRINHLPIEQLESLGEALLDFGAIADLNTWLQK